jgi:hypothetical protein
MYKHNNTIKAELPSRQNSDLISSGTGSEDVILYTVVLLKVVGIFNVNISIKSLVLKHQLH